MAQHSANVRLYTEQPFTPAAELTLDTGQSHYLMNVMRLKAGDNVSVFNGKDGEWHAIISGVSKRSCRILLEAQTRPQANVPDLWLLFAPVKRIRLDFLVQKATELGVRKIQPVITRRTMVARVNLDRLKANVIEAAEQTGRLSVPDIMAPKALQEVLREWTHERSLYYCDEHSGSAAESAVTVLTRDRSAQAAVLVGPEGGFEPAERDHLRDHSFVKPLTLGPRIMRADTVVMAVLSLWQATNGDW